MNYNGIVQKLVYISVRFSVMVNRGFQGWPLRIQFACWATFRNIISETFFKIWKLLGSKFFVLDLNKSTNVLIEPLKNKFSKKGLA